MKTNNNSLPTLKAPKGYHFKVQKYSQHSIYVRLYDADEREVGHIELVLSYPYNTKRLATHSWLHEDLRGKGYGTLLYSKAIEWGMKHGYKVRSSGGSSEMAQRVWNGKGIRRHFTIRHINNRLSDCGTWYAYPKKAAKRAIKKAIKKDRAKNKRR